MKEKKILLVAGDPSADLHGANLVRQLKIISPETKIFSLGGLHLASVSDRFLYNLVELAVFGLGDSIKNYFLFRKIFRNVVLKFLDEEKPDCVVPLDFYGFNIHLAQEAKKRELTVIYYISPQIWASRPGRIGKLAQSIDKMIVILPFEEEIYRKAGINTAFFGHPLLDIVPAPQLNRQLPDHQSLVFGLLPGSRKSVISRHLPILFAIAKSIKEKFPESKFFLPWTKNMPIDYLRQMVKTSPVEISLVNDENYEERRRLTLAFACSGTATLENALLGIPTIIIYRTTWFFYLVARSLVKVPYIGLVNIISGKNLFPEFIQHQISTKKIVEKAETWLTDRQEWQNLNRELLDLRKKLGGHSRTVKETGQSPVSRLIAEEIKLCINA